MDRVLLLPSVVETVITGETISLIRRKLSNGPICSIFTARDQLTASPLLVDSSSPRDAVKRLSNLVERCCG